MNQIWIKRRSAGFSSGSLERPYNSPRFSYRQFALGTEINVFNRSWLNIPLRAGLNKNISEDSALTYTAGFGLNFLHFTLDLGGAVSSETEDIHTDGTKTTIPANIAVAAQLALNF